MGIVERLRETAHAFARWEPVLADEVQEAADRIEALEMQLESANEALREQLDIREALEAENERLREALEWIADRPGEGVEYLPGHGDEVISEARNMELIARAALKEIEGD